MYRELIMNQNDVLILDQRLAIQRCKPPFVSRAQRARAGLLLVVGLGAVVLLVAGGGRGSCRLVGDATAGILVVVLFGPAAYGLQHDGMLRQVDLRGLVLGGAGDGQVSRERENTETEQDLFHDHLLCVHNCSCLLGNCIRETDS